MSDVFNKGDTAYLLLNFTVNGEPAQMGVYQEIEVQINPQGNYRGIKKLFSRNEIVWMTDMEYEDAEGEVQTYTGYVCSLTQDDTFTISDGETEMQIRVLYQGEVGSTPFIPLQIGKALSKKVLT